MIVLERLLRVPELRICRAGFKQFFVRSVTDDISFVHDIYFVRAGDVREAMRYHKNSSALRETVNLGEYIILALNVDIRGCLVENVHRAVMKKRTRER